MGLWDKELRYEYHSDIYIVLTQYILDKSNDHNCAVASTFGELCLAIIRREICWRRITF